ncbi:hypothetical protein IWQ60_005073 [Tieghemiomyces parasiticus]|uniref:Nudix hydrolase domain-containing protein n=1 Tax=Tieghemiomyces parasiticus TaxID=78921 RepID=A0A9W8DZ71_9FUNG|nr:hypothetical protein IWQ60_005073 [Tieghemiomyces parasiticus]
MSSNPPSAENPRDHGDPDALSLTVKNTPINLDKVHTFAAYRDWAAKLTRLVTPPGEQDSSDNAHPQAVTGSTDIHIGAAHVQSVDEFGSGKVGFVKLRLDAHYAVDEAPIPGVVFLRGGSVAILLLIRAAEDGPEGVEYAVLTVQPRLAVPHPRFVELPAGMLDGSGAFKGAAARELGEETGIQVTEADLIDLTELAYADTALERDGLTGVYPSPGACDESLRLYLCRKTVRRSQLEELRGRLTGQRATGERIALRLCPLDQLWRETRDVKVLAALALYEGLRRNGRLPKTT